MSLIINNGIRSVSAAAAAAAASTNPTNSIYYSVLTFQFTNSLPRHIHQKKENTNTLGRCGASAIFKVCLSERTAWIHSFSCCCGCWISLGEAINCSTTFCSHVSVALSMNFSFLIRYNTRKIFSPLSFPSVAFVHLHIFLLFSFFFFSLHWLIVRLYGRYMSSIAVFVLKIIANWFFNRLAKGGDRATDSTEQCGWPSRKRGERHEWGLQNGIITIRYATAYARLCWFSNLIYLITFRFECVFCGSYRHSAMAPDSFRGSALFIQNFQIQTIVGMVMQSFSCFTQNSSSAACVY